MVPRYTPRSLDRAVTLPTASRAGAGAAGGGDGADASPSRRLGEMLRRGAGNAGLRQRRCCGCLSGFWPWAAREQKEGSSGAVPSFPSSGGMAILAAENRRLRRRIAELEFSSVGGCMEGDVLQAAPSLPTSNLTPGLLERRYTQADTFGDGTAFNEVMREFWPCLRGFIEEYVLLGIVEPALKKLVWSGMRFETCSLGDLPPTILGAKAFRSHQEDGGDSSVELAMNVDFPGCGVDVTVLVARGLRTSMKEMRIRGTFCFTMRRFMRDLPLMAGMTLYFMNPPEVSISFSGVMQALEGRIVSVQSIIERQLANALVVPNRLALHLASPPNGLSYYDLRHPPPHGMLDVSLRCARVFSEGLWPSLVSEYRTRLRLGAEEWCSPLGVPLGDGNVEWRDTTHSFIVDKLHGQSLMVNLFREETTLFGRVSRRLGTARISVKGIADATRLKRPYWQLEVDPQDTVDVSGPCPLLRLTGMYRPLFSGSGLDEARRIETLADGTQGVLLLIIEDVRNLDSSCDGAHVQVCTWIGDDIKESWRVLAHQMTPEDVPEKTRDKMNYLLSSGHGQPALSTGDVAWLLNMQESQVSAIQRKSIKASFCQALRLRVQDPFSESLTVELRRGHRRVRPIARYTLPIRDLLRQGRWTMPLEERPFHEYPLEDTLDLLRQRRSGTTISPPQFTATFQFMGLGPAMDVADLPGAYDTYDTAVSHALTAESLPDVIRKRQRLRTRATEHGTQVSDSEDDDVSDSDADDSRSSWVCGSGARATSSSRRAPRYCGADNICCL